MSTSAATAPGARRRQRCGLQRGRGARGWQVPDRGAVPDRPHVLAVGTAVEAGVDDGTGLAVAGFCHRVGGGRRIDAGAAAEGSRCHHEAPVDAAAATAEGLRRIGIEVAFDAVDSQSGSSIQDATPWPNRKSSSTHSSRSAASHCRVLLQARRGRGTKRGPALGNADGGLDASAAFACAMPYRGGYSLNVYTTSTKASGAFSAAAPWPT